MAEELYGQAGVEADHGFEPALPSPFEPPKEDQPTFGSDRGGLEDAASELTKARAENNPPVVERNYHNFENGEWKDKVADNLTIDARRAARDLAAARELETEANDQAEAAALAEETDKVRNGAPLNSKLGEQPDFNQPQPDSPAVDPPAQGLDPELARALQHPQVRQAIEAQVGQATAAVQAYSQATAEVGQIAVAGLLSAFPEMANITTQQLPVVMQSLAQNNPARHAEIMAHINRVDGIYKAHVQAKTATNAIAQHQFKQYAAEQDRAFEESVKDLAPSEVRALGEKAIDLAEKHYGVSRQQLAQLYSTNDVFRSAPFQRMILDATRYHVALERSARPSAKPVPQVQRPGVRESYSGRDSGAADRALVAFRENATPKTAAALLRARRSAGA